MGAMVAIAGDCVRLTGGRHAGILVAMPLIFLWQEQIMKRPTPHLISHVLLPLIMSACGNSAWGQLCVQLGGGIYSENFDTLSASGSSNSSSSLPMGWAFSEAGSGNNITYAASDGSSSTGNTYSYGTGTSTDRALGELTSTTLQSTLGACFVNNTGATIRAFSVGYTGEQWRLGVADATADRLDFQYSLNATSLNSGSWTSVNSLDFLSPNDAASAGALNGNAAANRQLLSPTYIKPAGDIGQGSTFFIRWVPTDIGGANDGLAIDNFTLDPHVCSLNVDGTPGNDFDPLTDGLILIRAMFGLTGTAVTAGAIGTGATRNTWTQIQTYLNANCGTNFAP